MMKRIILCLSMLLLLVSAHTTGIEFYEGNWKDALAEAKAQDKMVFVDAYAKWCGPCKRMARDVFTRDEVGSFFNENFINLKIDMEEGQGLEFGKKYPVAAFPTLFFLDGDGEIIKKVTGGQKPDGLINHGKMALASFDKSEEYAALYEEGNRDYLTVYKYVKALNMAGKPSLKIANDYILSKPDISDEELALFLFEAAVEADSRLFNKMLDYKEMIIEKQGMPAFKKKVSMACAATINKSVDYDIEILKDEALEKCKEALGKESEVESLKLNMDYAALMNQDDEYFDHVKKLSKEAKKDHTLYKYMVNDMKKRYEGDSRTLDLSLKFTEELCKKELNAENAIMKSMALINVKKLDETIKWVEESLTKIDKSDPFWFKLESVIKYVEGLKRRQNLNGSN